MKAVATDPDGSVLFYQWSFGDGQVGEKLPVTDPYVLQADHTYVSATPGTVFSATITVWDDADATATATYPVVIMADDLATRSNIAIDKALWWVHVNMNRYDVDLEPCGEIDNGGWDPGMVTDAFALQALEQQGHLPSGNPGTDPYVEDAKRLVNEITRWIMVRPSETKGDGVTFPVLDPDTNGDGLLMATYEDYLEWELGVVLKALANANIPGQYPALSNEGYNLTGDPAKSIRNFTYAQIVQNMVDYIAWAQLYDHPNDYAETSYFDGTQWQYTPAPRKTDAVELNPKCRGSWNYWVEGWRDPVTNLKGGWGDTAMAFWTTLGLKAAESNGYVVPPFVKDELALFFAPEAGHQNLDPADPNYGEFYFGPNDGEYGGVNYHLIERAAEGLFVLHYLGVPDTDERVQAALYFMDRHWNEHNYDIGQSHPGPYRSYVTGEPLTYSDSYATWYVDAFTGQEIYDWASGIRPNWYNNGSDGMNYSFFHPYETDGTSILYGFEQGFFDELGNWVVAKTGDDINIFALYAVSRALDVYSVTQFPKAYSVAGDGTVTFTSHGPLNDPAGFTWDDRIHTLLTDNQLGNGGYDEYNWVYGSPFGTPWALMTLMEQAPVASDPSMAITGIDLWTALDNKGTTETLYAQVRVADSVGAPLSGATVDGAFLLANGDSVPQSGATDSLGTANFSYSQRRQLLPAGTYTFCVQQVAAPGRTWADVAPVCGTLTK